MPRRLRLRLPVLAAAVVAVLTACGDAPGAGTLPPLGSGASTTSPSASPDAAGASIPASPTATASPSASLSPEQQAAVQAVRDYFAAFEESYRAGNTQPLRARSTNVCPCLQAADRIDGLLADGGQVQGGEFEVQFVGQPIVTEGPPLTTASVEVVADQREGQATRDGEVVATIPAMPGNRVVVNLVREGSQWLVDEVDA